MHAKCRRRNETDFNIFISGTGAAFFQPPSGFDAHALDAINCMDEDIAVSQCVRTYKNDSDGRLDQRRVRSQDTAAQAAFICVLLREKIWRTANETEDQSHCTFTQ